MYQFNFSVKSISSFPPSAMAPSPILGRILYHVVLCPNTIYRFCRVSSQQDDGKQERTNGIYMCVHVCVLAWPWEDWKRCSVFVCVDYLLFSPTKAELGRELHAISCASKSLTGFITRDGIQECREACGGHGYLTGMAANALYRQESLTCFILPWSLQWTSWVSWRLTLIRSWLQRVTITWSSCRQQTTFSSSLRIREEVGAHGFWQTSLARATFPSHRKDYFLSPW